MKKERTNRCAPFAVYRTVFVGWGHDPTETLWDDSSIDCYEIKRLATNKASQML